MIGIIEDKRIVFRIQSKVYWRIDRADFEDLISELLMNARDFSDKVNGVILIEILKDGHSLTIRVADNGKGVHPEVLPHLFQMFKRYPPSRMGLGLAYARALVSSYGGEISVKSEFGKGAAFCVVIHNKNK